MLSELWCLGITMMDGAMFRYVLLFPLSLSMFGMALTVYTLSVPLQGVDVLLLSISLFACERFILIPSFSLSSFYRVWTRNAMRLFAIIYIFIPSASRMQLIKRSTWMRLWNRARRDFSMLTRHFGSRLSCVA